MSAFDEVSARAPRPLPVVILADVSGSMEEEDRIGVLNAGMREMLTALRQESDVVGDIEVAVILVGGDSARIHVPLSSAQDVEWLDMVAYGRTPLGDAFRQVAELLEDESLVPARAYQPTLVLLSDGIPTDDWRTGLDALLASKRGPRAQRIAVRIGVDDDSDAYAVLDAFVGGIEGRIYRAAEAADIAKALRWITMTVTTRSRSARPDDLPPLDPGEFEG